MDHRSLLLEAAVMGLVLLLTPFLAPQTLVAGAVALFCLFYATHRFAPRFFPHHARVPRLLLTLITLLGIQSILQTLAYYLNIPLGPWTDAATELLSIWIGTVAVFFTKSATEETDPSSDEAPNTASSFLRRCIQEKRLFLFQLVLLGCTGASASYIIYHTHRLATTAAIRTPWEVLPPGILLAFTCVFAAAWLMAWRGRSVVLTWLLAAGFFLLIALITPLLYPLGFGFDGFLHRASELILFQTGSLQPKPFYYIGQYTLITWLARTLILSIQSVDTFLLAGCVALLPATFALRIPSGEKRFFPVVEQIAMSLMAVLALIPLKPWITTTPQSFAYLMGLGALFLASLPEKKSSPFSALVLGGWSVVIHPLAGLPLFGGTLLALSHSWLIRFPRIRALTSACLALGTALIVPLAFFLHSRLSGIQITWDASGIFSLARWQALTTTLITPPLGIALWPDWAAFVEYLFPLILLAFVVTGLWKCAEQTASEKQTRYTLAWVSITGILVMLAAWGMQQAATFTFLITYERQDYIQRLFFIGQLLLLPAAVSGFVRVWNYVKRQPALPFFAFIVFTIAWQAARIYRAFPYHDATHIEHGWNTSQAALEAVRWIEHNSKNQPYTVLADQSVSAGAVAELGFKRYADDIFFYPLPTGGALYQVFLRAATAQVKKEDIEEAARLGKSSLVYLILSEYWWQADEAAKQLEALAGNSYSIDGGAMRVYRFEVNNAKNR